MNETYAQVSSTLRQAFNAAWDTDDAMVTWENAPAPLEGDDPWVRFSLRFMEPDDATLGVKCVHLRGIIAIQVFTRYDVGTGQSERLIDKIRAAVEHKSFNNNIVTYVSSVIPIGDSVRQLNHIESTWFQTLVNTPFETT